MAVLGSKNIIATYVGLATALSETQVWEEPEYMRCSSKLELSICNFAARFRMVGSFELNEERLDSLLQHARRSRSFRAFLMPGDEPADVQEWLENLGFWQMHELVQMGCAEAASDASLQLQRAESEADRVAVAKFMAEQFFGSYGASFREPIVRATAGSRHRLEYYVEGGTIRAAVMLTESEATIGLYNLCVAKPYRKKGLGASMVNEVIEAAREVGRFVTLQCDESLRNWYEKRGFKQTGTLVSLAI
jgi:GNAT superfamily N-acetyltransferase